MVKRRFAVFYNPDKDEPYSVVCQVREFWWWHTYHTTTDGSEGLVTSLWQKWVKEETDRQLPLGDEIKGWKP